MKKAPLDLRRVLAAASAYDIFSKIIGSSRFFSVLINEYIKPEENHRILDLGCGTAKILDFLPRSEYVGIDISRLYIDSAVKEYSSRAKFACEKIDRSQINKYSNFNLVLAIGLLHHLDDLEAGLMFEIAQGALLPQGRLITVDACYDDRQPRFSRFLMSKDRGKFIRNRQGYLSIASKFFLNPKWSIRNDLSSLPYTYIIIECTA